MISNQNWSKNHITWLTKKEKRPTDKKLRENKARIFVLYFINIFIMAILSHKMIDRNQWVVIIKFEMNCNYVI